MSLPVRPGRFRHQAVTIAKGRAETGIGVAQRYPTTCNDSVAPNNNSESFVTMPCILEDLTSLMKSCEQTEGGERKELPISCEITK